MADTFGFLLSRTEISPWQMSQDSTVNRQAASVWWRVLLGIQAIVLQDLW
ncbi:MAG: hypothetical protein ABSA47_12860 [Verrucomicrobiota bacterium]